MMRKIIATAAAVGVLVLTAAAAVAVSRFTDVGDDHPLAAEIDAAAAEGWMLGYSDGTFGPDQTLTQSQLRKVLSRVLDDLETITRAEAAVFVVAGADAVKAHRAPPVVDEPAGEPGEEPGGEPGEEPTVTQPIVDEPAGEPGEEPGGEPGEEPTVTQPPPTSAPPAPVAPTPEQRCQNIYRRAPKVHSSSPGWEGHSYTTLTATGEGDNLQCLVNVIYSPGVPGVVQTRSDFYTIEIDENGAVYGGVTTPRRRYVGRHTMGVGRIFETEELPGAETSTFKMVNSDIVTAFFQAQQAGTRPPAVPAKFVASRENRVSIKTIRVAP